MDPEIVAEIMAQLPFYEAWHIQRFTQPAMFYHYVLTLDDEVSQIWPQPAWKMGKILFLGTRYTGIVYMACILIFTWPNTYEISVPVCDALCVVMNVTGMLTRTFPEAAVWLCLYALLGGKPKYFYLLVTAFLGLTVPAIVLNGMNVLGQRAIPRTALDHALGYPCNFIAFPRPDLSATSFYIVFSRASLALVVGLSTLLTRYRKQKHNLIRIIRREGGIYCVSTLILMFLSGLAFTPGIPVSPPCTFLW
ncbi:hypothetical protein FA13DRAFT_94854 [Coprinellus micaceus]|uniref:DUF6533 domain-containing protein n=1 Tax=Coprinellus micaceus TaxID=71717 RepID=A0A4Y7SIK8_COPMI|nr:hypothetical protein FA13DRAFT_94854 [Coprinellus micaceus]